MAVSSANTGPKGTVATAINPSGQIVGYYEDGNGKHDGFLYSNSSYTTLNDPSGNDTVATGINASSQIVGYYNNNGVSYGFLYSNGTWTTLNDPSASNNFAQGTWATGINDSGQIVGYYSDGTFGRSTYIYGFLYSDGIYTTINDPSASHSFGNITYAMGINDSGQIVGSYFGSSYNGFIANPGPFTWATGASGNFAVAANWNPEFVPSASTDIAISPSGVYAVTSSVDETINSLTTQAGAALDVTGGTFTINNGTDSGSNAGTLLAATGGTLVLDGGVSNSGAIEASGGIIDVAGAISGTGAVTLGVDGTLELNAGGSIAGNMQFTGTAATLRLDSSVSQIGGDIVGAAATDSIDLAFIGFASGNQAVWQQMTEDSGSLLLVDNGTTLATLNLVGQYTSANFTAVSDNQNGTLIEVQNAPPVLSGGGNSVNYTPQGAAVAVDSGLGVSEAESATLAGATVAISAGLLAGDTLNFTNQNGIAGSYNASTGVLTLTGSASLANYQAALESITFSSTSGNPSDWDTDLSRTVSWTVTDGTLSSNTIASTIIVGPATPSSTPPGTTADMILRNGTNGDYVILDIGNNSILAASSLGQVGLEWQVAGVGGFFGTDTTDMMLHDSNNGAFEVYDISNNAITGAASMGQVGSEWQVSGFGDFSSNPGETDMLMRNSNTGAFEVYDISHNAITSAAAMGAVGSEWTVAGFGDFSSRAGETDMLMRDSHSGAFEVYDIRHNAITSAASMGAVGLEWMVAGFGDFSGNANETDTITSAASMGQVGLLWQVGGIGADPPAASPAAASSAAATALLVQAIAAFPSGGAALDQGPINQASQEGTSQPGLFAAPPLAHAV